VKKNIFLVVIAILTVVIIYIKSYRVTTPKFVCSDSIGCVTILPGEPVKIGVLQDFSGGAANVGVDQLRSIEITLKEQNNQLLNHPIVLLKEDEKCSFEGGLVGSDKLVTDSQVVAVLGTTCSEAAKSASQVMSEAGLTMLSGANTAPSLTSENNKKGDNWHLGYFRVMPNTMEMAKGVAKFVFQKLGITKVAMVNDGDTYTVGYAESFNNEFVMLGGEIVLNETVSKGEKNMVPVLEAIAYSGAELVFLALYQEEGQQITLQAKKVPELADTTFLVGEAMLTEKFLQITGGKSKGFYFINNSPESRSAESHELAGDFVRLFGESPKTAGYDYAYDATCLLLSAIKKVAKQGEDNVLYIGRQALRDTLYATKNFQGITGSLTCDKFGDCGVPRYNIVRLDNPEAGLQGLKSNIVYSPTDK